MGNDVIIGYDGKPRGPWAGATDTALGRGAAAPFVGRDAALAQALDAAADAAAGRLRVVLVTGDAGAGKTALADRVSQRLAAESWAVTAGRCPEHEGAPAGWAWAQALRQLAAAAAPAEPQPLAALLTDPPEHH